MLVADALHLPYRDQVFDALVTDPPAGIAFMGKKWDHDRGGRRQWVDWMTRAMSEALRVCKPGAHGFVWALPRTAHWTAWALEDAGWEIRDAVVHHCFGSGFPKSLAVDKAIDKMRTEDQEASARVCRWLVDRMKERGFTRRMLSDHFDAENIAQQWTTFWLDGAVKPRVPTVEQWRRLKELLDFSDEMDREVWRLNGRKGQPGENWFKRELLATENRFNAPSGIVSVGRPSTPIERKITAPATREAAKWQGWGSSLKPSYECWHLVRKPLSESSIAANVLRWGCGGINVEAGRVKGRWPANLCFSHHPECEPGRPCAQGCPVGDLDRQSGAVGGSFGRRGKGNLFGGGNEDMTEFGYRDSGGASRFFHCFYTPKAPTSERKGSKHPTVKPLSLMEHLIRLICPVGGRVLDPFAGSFTTLEAATRTGRECAASDIDPEYVTDGKRRMENAQRGLW